MECYPEIRHLLIKWLFDIHNRESLINRVARKIVDLVQDGHTVFLQIETLDNYFLSKDILSLFDKILVNISNDELVDEDGDIIISFGNLWGIQVSLKSPFFHCVYDKKIEIIYDFLEEIVKECSIVKSAPYRFCSDYSEVCELYIDPDNSISLHELAKFLVMARDKAYGIPSTRFEVYKDKWSLSLLSSLVYEFFNNLIKSRNILELYVVKDFETKMTLKVKDKELWTVELDNKGNILNKQINDIIYNFAVSRNQLVELWLNKKRRSFLERLGIRPPKIKREILLNKFKSALNWLTDRDIVISYKYRKNCEIYIPNLAHGNIIDLLAYLFGSTVNFPTYYDYREHAIIYDTFKYRNGIMTLAPKFNLLLDNSMNNRNIINVYI